MPCSLTWLILFTGWGGNIGLAAQFPRLMGIFQNRHYQHMWLRTWPKQLPKPFFKTFLPFFGVSSEKWRCHCQEKKKLKSTQVPIKFAVVIVWGFGLFFFLLTALLETLLIQCPYKHINIPQSYQALLELMGLDSSSVKNYTWGSLSLKLSIVCQLFTTTMVLLSFLLPKMVSFSAELRRLWLQIAFWRRYSILSNTLMAQLISDRFLSLPGNVWSVRLACFVSQHLSYIIISYLQYNFTLFLCFWVMLV